jgi:MFS family permease
MKLFEKKELAILWPFYFSQLISKLFYLLPGFMILYFIRLDYSIFQIGIFMAVWQLFSLISDIPTGVFADLYGRKFSVLFGTLLMSLGFLLLYFYKDYYIILGLMAFIGIANTFISGANDAWATDLVNKKDKKLLPHFFAKSMSFSSIGFVMAGLIGAYFVKNFGINIIWIISSLSFFAGFIILLFAEEYHIRKKTTILGSLKGFFKNTKISLKYSYNKKPLFYILFAGTIFIFASGFSNTLTWTPLLKSLNYPDYALGYFISAISFIGIFAPLISIKLIKKRNERKIIFCSMIGIMVFVFGIILAMNIPLVFIMVLSMAFFQYIVNPTSNVYFQRFIPSNLRAAIGSIESTLISLAGIISLPLAGVLVDLIGPKYTIFISGFIMIPVIIIYHKLKKFEK